VLAGKGFEFPTTDTSSIRQSWPTPTRSSPSRTARYGLTGRGGVGWGMLTRRLGDRIGPVGDDIFLTNPRVVAKGIHAGVANSVLIKPNRFGTLTETLETVVLARRARYRVYISHRSGRDHRRVHCRPCRGDTRRQDHKRRPRAGRAAHRVQSPPGDRA
jgi:enolase